MGWTSKTCSARIGSGRSLREGESKNGGRPLQVTILTGATSGIGAAMAAELSGTDRALLLVGRRQKEGEALAASLPGNVRFLASDLSDPSAPDRIVTAARDMGKVHTLINNAGIMEAGRADETSDDVWSRIMEINVNAVFRMSRAVIAPMREAGAGVILNVASDWALIAARGALAYAVSKAAVAQMTRCMAADHAQEGIRVNAICPGDTDTPMLARGVTGAARSARLEELGAKIPMGRVAQADEVAKVAAFLVSEAASFMTGALVPVDGGNSTGVES